MSDHQTNPPPKGPRTQILEAAAHLFAENGYHGTGIRDIEAAAGVNRGVVTYHFGNKEDVWKAMFDYEFMPYLNDFRSRTKLLIALDPRTRTRFLIEGFVRMSAEKPYLNRLMIQENFTESWRSDWIIKNFLEPVRELNHLIADGDPFLSLVETDPHVRYAILGACNAVFSHRCEVKALFSQNVSEDAFVERHVATMIKIVDALLDRATAQEEKSNV